MKISDSRVAVPLPDRAPRCGRNGRHALHPPTGGGGAMPAVPGWCRRKTGRCTYAHGVRPVGVVRQRLARAGPDDTWRGVWPKPQSNPSSDHQAGWRRFRFSAAVHGDSALPGHVTGKSRKMNAATGFADRRRRPLRIDGPWPIAFQRPAHHRPCIFISPASARSWAASAALAREGGARATGCDAGVYPPMSDQLRALGIELIEGFGADQMALKPDIS